MQDELSEDPGATDGGGQNQTGEEAAMNGGASAPAKKTWKRKLLKRLALAVVILVVGYGIFRVVFLSNHYVSHPDGLAVFGKNYPGWKDTFLTLDEINGRIARSTQEEMRENRVYPQGFVEALGKRGLEVVEPGSAPNEEWALDLLMNIWQGEQLFCEDVTKDADGDDVGEYGTLAELTSQEPVYVNKDLADGRLRGYLFRIEIASSADEAEKGFRAFADPEDESFGCRHFFLDQTGAVRSSNNGPAGPGDVVEKTFEAMEDEGF